MPDYSTLTNEELITELNTRDATIVAKDGEIATLNQSVAEKDGTIEQLNGANSQLQMTLDGQVVQITDLNTQLDESAQEIDHLNTSDGVIETLNGMTKAQKQTLQSKTRSTAEGVKAYRAFNYAV